jgi:hypothetical protein
MAEKSLTDFIDSLGPVKEFKPQPYLCADSDTLTMYFEDSPAFRQRVDSKLTVFKAFDTGDLVGFELKNVLPKIKELLSLIHVEAKSARVHVKLILLICSVEAESREPYQELANKSSEFDANIPVLA